MVGGRGQKDLSEYALLLSERGEGEWDRDRLDRQIARLRDKR